MDLTKFWVIVIFIVCCEQSCGTANNVNALDKDRPDGRSRPKKSAATEIYLALPLDNNIKTGKQDGPPTLIRLDPSAPNKFKGKFPTPIERFVQRIQNYFSVYNPPEYLNDLRPGINNPETDGEPLADLNYTNESQIVLPCNGTSTIVIIPVPLDSENGPQNHYTNPPDVPEAYRPPPKSTTTTSTTPKPAPCPEGITSTSTTTPPCTEETIPPKSPCPEVTTTTTTTTTTTPKPNCPGVTTTTVKPKCTELPTTTPKPKCPEETASKHEYPQEITQRPFFPIKQSTSKPKPVSGYDGPNEAPPLNLVAKPVLGSTVVYFYKHPSTSSSKPPSYYVPTTPNPIYEEIYTERTKPPILRLKQLLFPRLYAAFHPDE